MEERELKRRVKPEQVIDLKKLFFALLKKWWLIIIVTVVFFAGGYIRTKLFVTPTYMSSFTAYINNYNVKETLQYVNSSDMYTRSALADTVADIAKSVTVKQEVADKTGLESYGMIGVSTSVDEKSSVLTVKIVLTDKDKVKECADNFAIVLTEETSRIIEGSSMQVIDSPREPVGRYAPSYFSSAVKIGLIGFVLICALLIVLALMDDTMTNPSELEDAYGLPIIGSIPNLASRGDKYGYNKSYGYEYGYGNVKNKRKKEKEGEES